MRSRGFAGAQKTGNRRRTEESVAEKTRRRGRKLPTRGQQRSKHTGGGAGREALGCGNETDKLAKGKFSPDRRGTGAPRKKAPVFGQGPSLVWSE